jgi:hypothetical protein
MHTNNPLASVQFNESENFLKDSIYEAYLSTFLYREIGKKLNISFDDFLNRPKYEIEMMVRIISEVDDKRNKINATMLENLEKAKPNKSLDID